MLIKVPTGRKTGYFQGMPTCGHRHHFFPEEDRQERPKKDKMGKFIAIISSRCKFRHKNIVACDVPVSLLPRSIVVDAKKPPILYYNFVMERP
jgi:hypothetical protein